MLTQPWQITLFGGLKAEQPNRTVARFQTAKTGALLAYLAYFCRRAHTRDELTELLWPDSDPVATRNRLRVALSSLRRQLEPPGVPPGSVLETDRRTVRLQPSAFQTDIQAFERALQSADGLENQAGEQETLAEAMALYTGDLLHGYDEIWLLSERERLASLYRKALRRLAELYGQNAREIQALDCALRLIAAAPWEEQGYLLAMRCCLVQGRRDEALHHYADMERRFKEGLDLLPSLAIRQFAARLKQSLPSVLTRKPPSLNTRQVASSHPVTPLPPLPPEKASSKPKLPLPLTRFVGRESEVAHLTSWLKLSKSRLVTVTGLGGVGKTRFCLEIAHRTAEAFPGGLAFVSLADIPDPTHLYTAILQAIGGRPRTDRSALESITDALPSLSMLLILDNFEHLVEQGGDLLIALLQDAPQMTCLVSSRQALMVAGERQFGLAPLPTPGQTDALETLAECASVQLFVDRAQAICSDFQITARNSLTIAQLCIALEGIPLAIELAASWTRILTPAQMLEHLPHRLDLLVHRRNSGEARHRTLRATIEWSYKALTPELQRFFRALAVFRGGCTPAGAAALVDDVRAWTSLEQLRERSLLVVEEQVTTNSISEMRCRLLETLREFAAEQTGAEEIHDWQTRHAHYYLHLAEEAEPNLLGHQQTVWLICLERELDNMRAALDYFTLYDRERSLRLAGALWRFWLTRGYLHEGRQRLAQALAAPSTSLPARIRALGGAGALALAQGDNSAAQRWCEEQAQLARHAGDETGEADALHRLGNAALFQAELEKARTLYQQCVLIRRRLGDRQGMGLTLNNLGALAYEQGDFAAAQALYEEFLTTCRDLGDQRGMGGALSQLGILARAQKDFHSAHALFGESLELRRALGDQQGIAFTLANMANVAFDEGDWAHSGALARESLVLFQQLGDQGHIAVALRDMAHLAYMQGFPARAARLYGAEEALRNRLGAGLPPRKQTHYEGSITALRAALGSNAFQAAWAQGGRLTLESALTLALEETA